MDFVNLQLKKYRLPGAKQQIRYLLTRTVELIF